MKYIPHNISPSHLLVLFFFFEYPLIAISGAHMCMGVANPLEHENPPFG